MTARARSLNAGHPGAIVLPDGSTAEKTSDGLAVRGPDGALRLVYEGGNLTLFAADGDVRLVAPRGGVVVDARDDVMLRSQQTIRWESPRAEIVARVLETTVSEARTIAEKIESAAAVWIQRSRRTLRETTELEEVRAGRMRTLVRDVLRSVARRTSIKSEEETSIDGKKIHLG